MKKMSVIGFALLLASGLSACHHGKCSRDKNHGASSEAMKGGDHKCSCCPDGDHHDEEDKK